MKGARRILLALACGFGLVAWAQDQAIEAQNKLLAKRAAEVDCYRKLAENVYGVQITSDTYVRDFITESDVIRSALDTFVKGIKLGPGRYYPDGVCEVDGEVVVSKLITRLKEIHAAHYRGNTLVTADFEQIKQTLKKEVIRATGSGAPRPELPPDVLEGIEDVLTPLPPGAAMIPPVIPPIWRSVGPQARLMASRAARIDAQRRLLEQIKGLRLTSDTLVRDFITESDQIMTQADGLVVGASQVGRAYYHTDELIAEVTMEVPVTRVITKIKELHSQYYRGNRVTTTDITNVKKILERNTIRATGSGVPAPRFVARAETAGFETPDWFGQRIKATGQGTGDLNSPQGKLMAVRAAELDAKRKLAEQVHGLQISSNTTVRDFIAEHDEITTQVAAVLRGAVSGEPVYRDGVAEVTVSIPASEVWTVVHQQTLILNRRG